jgi:tRNA-specific 2-thiouridylase
VATALGIPHYIVNYERTFDAQVISNFVREYAAGRTPIPCVHCNGDLKFSHLLARATALDADLVATGHYARVEHRPDDARHLLKRGLDGEKDQSYFLFSLDQAQLARACFPVGALAKGDVRAYARGRGLPVADKPDSHEICFVPDGDHAAFVERRDARVAREGFIADPDGRIVGRHGGVHRFTVGQRKGLGLSSTTPLYVLELDSATQTVRVGPREFLERNSLTAARVNWIAGAPPDEPLEITARIRHRHKEAAARVRALPDGRAAVEFDTPQTAIAPGQAVVFYVGDVVLGGGWIE